MESHGEAEASLVCSIARDVTAHRTATSNNKKGGLVVGSKEVGKMIRQKRKSLQWTQEHLAAKARMDKQYLSRIETGKQQPSLNILEDIANAFGAEGVALEAHGDAVTRLAEGRACVPHEVSPVRSTTAQSHRAASLSLTYIWNRKRNNSKRLMNSCPL